MPKAHRKPAAVAELESAIVRTVQALGAISRIELARQLKLVASTAGIYVDRLIEQGYLVERSKTTRGLGRPPVLLEIAPERGRFVGVDFDARQIMAVAVDFAQQPLVRLRRTIPTRATVRRVLSLVEQLVAEVIGDSSSDVLGIGLGVPGPVDTKQGISRHYRFIRGWHDVAIGSQVAAEFGVPVEVENNSRSMALGELWCGEGRGRRDLVCLSIRSGIGTGVIVDGSLLGGAHNQAGEIGRWVYPLGGDRPRTIEDIASLTGILAAAHERRSTTSLRSALRAVGGSLSVADLLQAAEAGDSLATSLVREAAVVHGWIAHQLVELLDPQRLIVAGPLVASDDYLAVLLDEAARLGGEERREMIARSTLGEWAAALGAAALAFHRWKPRR
jgi:predicted NBD/HSP70 family sugar kinase